MNPKKKSRRYRVSVSIHALDLAIYRFTHSLGYSIAGKGPTPLRISLRHGSSSKALMPNETILTVTNDWHWFMILWSMTRTNYMGTRTSPVPLFNFSYPPVGTFRGLPS